MSTSPVAVPDELLSCASYVSVASVYEIETLSFTLNAIDICVSSKIPPAVLTAFAAVVAVEAVCLAASRYE